MVAESFNVGMGLDLQNELLFFFCCCVAHRWDRRIAIVVPDEEVFYLVAFLRNVLLFGPGLESMLDENARILRVCEDLNGKHYLPKYTKEEQWKQHFGCEKWTAFVQHKHMFDPRAILAPRQNMFDPRAILAPGQNMFRRNQNPPRAGLAATVSFRFCFIMKLDFLLVHTTLRMEFDAVKT
jgi:hypothetical protein